MMDKKKIHLLGFWSYLKLTFIHQFCLILQKFIPYFSISIKLKLTGYQYPLWLRCGTSDYPCFHLIFVQNEFEKILAKLDPSVDVMIDGGGNVGYTSKFFAEKRKDLNIICLEPDSSNFALAKKNLSFFGQRINLLPKALWSHSTYVKVVDGYFGNGGNWALQVKETNDINDVSAISLNELINLENQYFIKLDIEGAEKVILNTQTNWTKQVMLLAVELHDDEAKIIFDKFREGSPFKYLGQFDEMHCLIKDE